MIIVVVVVEIVIEIVNMINNSNNNNNSEDMTRAHLLVQRGASAGREACLCGVNESFQMAVIVRYIHTCVYIYIYIYTYRERDVLITCCALPDRSGVPRVRETRERHVRLYIYMCIYIYIYI